jgi:hypothetical protein
LETIPGTKAIAWKKKSFEKRGRAVALLRRRHPVLKKAEGDWAATWLLRRRCKSHNRTLRERRKKERHPNKWAATMAARKVKRFKTLHEELAGGDIAEIERAILAKSRAQGVWEESEMESQASSARDESSTASSAGEEENYEQFYASDDAAQTHQAVRGPRNKPASQEQRPYIPESDDDEALYSRPRPPPKKASGKRERSPVQQDGRPPPKKAPDHLPHTPESDDDEALPSRPPIKKASGKRARSPAKTRPPGIPSSATIKAWGKESTKTEAGLVPLAQASTKSTTDEVLSSRPPPKKAPDHRPYLPESDDDEALYSRPPPKKAPEHRPYIPESDDDEALYSRPPPKNASGKRERSPVQQDSRPPPKKASGKRERSPVQQDSRPPRKKAPDHRPYLPESDDDEALSSRPPPKETSAKRQRSPAKPRPPGIPSLATIMEWGKESANNGESTAIFRVQR